jgi:glutamate:Na+ symporter, ESS family
VTLSAWYLLLLAVPVLLAGEAVCRRVPVLARFNIPAPVVGGLGTSLLVLALSFAGVTISFSSRTDAAWWTWLVTPEIEWLTRPQKAVNLPLLVAFFTCVGLNSTWRIVKSGSWQLLLFWGLATLLAVAQNFTGVALANVMGVDSLLGLICGSVSMTGGHGTALGFAETLKQAGYAEAATAGAAAATFGLVAGGLLGGPIGTRLIQRFRLPIPGAARASSAGSSSAGGILTDIGRLAGAGRSAVVHLLILAACIKVGAWVSYFLQALGIVFPAYMGALLVGVALRNFLDATGRPWIRSEVVDLIGAVALGLFLAMAMASLNLRELAGAAGPMLIILVAQVTLTALFAWWVTFKLLGRDYEAAVMAGGHCGFALGATPNAVANMDALTRRYGPAPRAYTVVPPVGAFLIDFTNALTITAFINFL